MRATIKRLLSTRSYIFGCIALFKQDRRTINVGNADGNALGTELGNSDGDDEGA